MGADLTEKVSHDVERLSPCQRTFSHWDPLHRVRVSRLLVHLGSISREWRNKKFSFTKAEHAAKEQPVCFFVFRVVGRPCLQGRCKAPAAAWGHLSVWSGSPPGPPGTPEPGRQFDRGCSHTPSPQHTLPESQSVVHSATCSGLLMKMPSRMR